MVTKLTPMIEKKRNTEGALNAKYKAISQNYKTMRNKIK